MKKTVSKICMIGLVCVFFAGCGNKNSDSDDNAPSAAGEGDTQEEVLTDSEIADEAEGDSDGLVQTAAGLLQGTVEDGIFRYLGVPYARAAERFVPAGALEPWEGIRAADSYGAISP